MAYCSLDKGAAYTRGRGYHANHGTKDAQLHKPDCKGPATAISTQHHQCAAKGSKAYNCEAFNTIGYFTVIQEP